MKAFFLCALLLLGALFLPRALQAESLNEYFMSQGCPQGLVMDYPSLDQEDQFIDYLLFHPEVSRIAQIGLHAGHMTEVFFDVCYNLRRLVSFDQSTEHHVQTAARYFEKQYPDSFAFVPGSPVLSIHSFIRATPDQKFDLIYLDGARGCSDCVKTISYGRMLSHPGTVLWVNHYEDEAVQKAVQVCERRHLIQLKGVHHSGDADFGKCAWAEATYVTC